MNQIYLDTARLLTQISPFVFVDGIFALKGGTAINLFVRDMPRLSVDLDLVFPDYRLPRTQALAAIADALRQSTERLTARGFRVRSVPTASGEETKLLVNRGGVVVKIEVNFVTRGTLHHTRGRDASDHAAYPCLPQASGYRDQFNPNLNGDLRTFDLYVGRSW